MCINEKREMLDPCAKYRDSCLQYCATKAMYNSRLRTNTSSAPIFHGYTCASWGHSSHCIYMLKVYLPSTYLYFETHTVIQKQQWEEAQYGFCIHKCETRLYSRKSLRTKYGSLQCVCLKNSYKKVKINLDVEGENKKQDFLLKSYCRNLNR